MSFYNGILNHYDESGSVNIKGARGAPGIGFKLDLNNDYDMQNKKLVNVKQGTNNNDVITKSQLDIKTSLLDGSRPSYVVNDKAAIYSSTGALHAQSLYLKDTPDNAGNSDEIRIMTEHQSRSNVHLNIPDIQNFDGYGGRPKSEVMVTSVEQTVTGKKVFENIEVHDPTSNNQAANKSYADTKLSLTGGTMTGDLILPHHNYPIPGNTNKVINYESQREIFLSRQESFPMQADINMNNNFIQNIATPTSSHQATNKGYCDYNFLSRQKGGVLMSSLSMNQNDLFEIPAPKYGNSAVNKNYVDTEITKVHQNLDLTPFLRKDGQRAMTGSLNMNGNQIIRLKEPVSSSDASTKGYTDRKIDNIQKIDTTLFIKKDGSVPMAADLDMGTHKISNVVNPEFDTDVVNKQYLKNKLIESHLQPSGPSNIFHFLMNDTSKFSSIREIIIGSFSDVEKVAHRLNKKALSILLQNDLQTVSYSARLGLDMTSLSVGDYTLVMEFYWPEKFNIYTYADSTPTNIVDEQNIKNFSNYQKLYLQFTKKNTNSPNNLIMEIRGELSTSNQQTGYLIFYGAKGTHYSITNDFYDQYIMSDIFIYNENMKMQTKIDMNNNKIIKLSNGTDPDDAVNVSQMDRLENEIIPLQTFIKNQIYIRIFKLHFYDLKEPILYRFSPPNLTGISNVWTPTEGLSFSSSSQGGLTINSLDPIKGLQFDSNMKILLNLGNTVGQSTPYTILISMTLKDKITLHFSNSTNSNDFHYPGYIIDYATEQLIFERQSGNYGVVYFPSKLKNKQVMIWIKFNPTSRHYQLNLAHVTTLNINEYPLSSFTATKLCIVPGNNIINKICYLNSYIDNADHFHHLIFEEKKNGSYFE